MAEPVTFRRQEIASGDLCARRRRRAVAEAERGVTQSWRNWQILARRQSYVQDQDLEVDPEAKKNLRMF